MPVVQLEDYEQALEARVEALGLTGQTYVLPNSGARRTEAKRALLRAIAEAAAEQGRTPPFKANCGQPSSDGIKTRSRRGPSYTVLGWR